MDKGVHRPAGPNDLRTPCPFVNALANHGHVPRDGRNVTANDFTSGCRALGISSLLAIVFSIPIRFEFGGIRRPGQVDKDGQPCIDISQISKPGKLEHDVSLSRRDAAQGDNCTPQPDLIEDLLACGDGNRITLDDLVALRKRRIETQTRENPALKYEKREHFLACGEMALILRMFGDGHSVPVNRVRAFFKDERFPLQEGWVKRSWWNSFGLFELLYRSWQIFRMSVIDLKAKAL